MGDYKYQISTYNLFDYAGVERHLEKMAAKGWRFYSIGKFFWVYRRAEPANLKYSVTYVPEASQFDPEPLEKQRNIEAYCEEAGWKKVGNWMQMQIFCSDNQEAVPIETDEAMRLEVIHKSMKRNYLPSQLLLLVVFLLNMVTTYGQAKNNLVEFLSSSGRLWTTGIWIWGVLLLLFDIGYYFIWLHRAKRAVKSGLACPKPRMYRHVVRIYWAGLLFLAGGLFGTYTIGMGIAMAAYLVLFFVIISVVFKIQESLKRKGVSKAGNAVITLGSCVFLTFFAIGGLAAALLLFDVGDKERTIEMDTIEINGQQWDIYHDPLPLPLYVEDFVEAEAFDSSRWVPYEQESILADYGEYHSDMFVKQGDSTEVLSLRYKVITAKAALFYEPLLEAYYEREFRYADDGEREKVEYRVTYEGEKGTMYRQYYEGLPMAHEWLVLTENNIIPMEIYLEELTGEQMQSIVEKLSQWGERQ